MNECDVVAMCASNTIVDETVGYVERIVLVLPCRGGDSCLVAAQDDENKRRPFRGGVASGKIGLKHRSKYGFSVATPPMSGVRH
jgi:hypothetical protein